MAKDQKLIGYGIELSGEKNKKKKVEKIVHTETEFQGVVECMNARTNLNFYTN